MILCQGQDGRVVGKISGENAYCAGTGKAVKGLHQRRQQPVEQVDQTKFRPQCAYCASQHGDGHDVKYRVDQKIMCGVHHGVEHVGSAHFAAQQYEKAEEKENKAGDFLRKCPLYTIRQLFFVFGCHGFTSFSKFSATIICHRLCVVKQRDG